MPGTAQACRSARDSSRPASLFLFFALQHELEMFSRGGRDQYWYEGVVVACLYVIMSTAILGTYSAASWKRYATDVQDTVDVFIVRATYFFNVPPCLYSFCCRLMITATRFCRQALEFCCSRSVVATIPITFPTPWRNLCMKKVFKV